LVFPGHLDWLLHLATPVVLSVVIALVVLVGLGQMFQTLAGQVTGHLHRAACLGMAGHDPIPYPSKFLLMLC
jgi:hypothetical protein